MIQYVPVVTPADQVLQPGQPISHQQNPLLVHQMPLVAPKKLGGIIPRRGDYDNCADLKESDYVTETNLIIVRGFFGYLMMMNVLTTIWLNWDFVLHLVFFFSYWGHAAGLLAIIFSNKAIQDVERWQFWACWTTEISMALNLVIVPLFWYELAPILFTLDWKGLNLITNIHLVTLHTVPLIATVVNVVLTKNFTFLFRDWMFMMVMGLVYIPCNYFGTIYEGAPLYPAPVDWSDPHKSFLYFLLLAVMITVAYMASAVVINHLRKPKA